MDSAKQKLSKSITTSVPSIAIRFHCGDEDVDIYPSADDEEDEETATESATPAPSVPPTPSRDASPIKEYFKGLGKRSTSVDSSMDSAPAPVPAPAPAAGDKWRLFHELRGKITKTVEEKLTEMKADRKASASASASSTPVMSGAGTRRERLRAGADRSSASEDEDMSELSGTAKDALKAADIQRSVSMDSEGVSALAPKQRKGKKSRSPKGAKADKKHRRKLSLSYTSSDDDSDNVGGVEAGVEAEEEEKGKQPKFAEEEEFQADTTVDYRTTPAKMYFADKRKVSDRGYTAIEPSLWTSGCRWAWRLRWLLAAVVALVAYFWYPLGTFANGMLAGVLLTLVAHFTFGLSGLLEPEDVVPRRPFAIPDYAAMPALETPTDPAYAQLTTAKCAGWMNELPYEYDPETYSLNRTQTVYVRLDGSTLRISHPRNKVLKRAAFDERKYKMKFVHQRIYDLTGCQLKLLPEGLTRRRIWSKKYPLCLVLPRGMKVNNEDIVEDVVDDNQDESTCDLPLADAPIYPSVPNFGYSADASASRTGVGASVSRPTLVNTRPRVASPSAHVLQKLSEERSSFLDGSGLYDSSVATRTGSAADVPASDGHEPLVTFEQPAAKEDEDDDGGFCLVDEEPELCLYLFARAGRQKEDWYRRIQMAIRFSAHEIPEARLPSPPPPLARDVSNVSVASRLTAVSTTTTATTTTTAPPYRQTSPVVCVDNEFNYDLDRPGGDELVLGRAGDIAALKYLQFMARLPVQFPKPGSRKKVLRVEREVDCDVLWINAIMGHILYDLLANPEMAGKVTEKIQKKLDLIKLPFFIEKLVLTDIDLGHDVPFVHRASRPVLDEHGLWVDLDITYEGSIKLTIETKLNLMKLKVKKDAYMDEEGGSPDSGTSMAPEKEEEEEDDGDDISMFEEGDDEEWEGELDPTRIHYGLRQRKPETPRASVDKSTTSLGKKPSSETGSSTERNPSLGSKTSPERKSSQGTNSSTEQKSPLGSKTSAERKSSLGSRSSAELKSSLKTKPSTERTSSLQVKAGSAEPRSATFVNEQSAIYNSEIEDSEETSESEPEKSAPTSSGESGGTKMAEPPQTKLPAASPTSKGMMRMMNKIVASKYFQQATEYKYIKRAMEGVSKTVITLTVEMKALSGQLAINFPPPPSDRVWYGFRGSPGIWLKAKPKFGERSVSMGRVVSFIEKKLVQELEKKLVLPNMEDLVIPPMTTELP